MRKANVPVDEKAQFPPDERMDSVAYGDFRIGAHIVDLSTLAVKWRARRTP
jgi:hypothetical protein